MFPIASQVVSGTSTQIVIFNNIPQTYSHLQIRVFQNYGATTSGDYQMSVTMNGDAYPNTNYSMHFLDGNGNGSAYSWGVANTWCSMVGNLGGANSTGGALTNVTPNASTFHVGIIDLLDYTSTVKNKTIKAITGYDANGIGSAYLASGSRNSTAAITSVTIWSTGNASMLLAGSRVDLYGLQTSSVTGA